MSSRSEEEDASRKLTARFGDLWTGAIHRFADWPSGDVPTTGAIVYTIWDHDDVFIYVGMSGRQYTPGQQSSQSSKGPWGRLARHASGRRSGDQFCLYICDRLVLSTLHNRIAEIAGGELSLDAATRDYVRTNLGFRWMALPDGRAAYDLERWLQRGEADCGRPLLNPL